MRYLAALRVDSGGGTQLPQLFGGVFAIFGHGNVAGVGEALYRHRAELPTYRAHNEQAMAHAAIAYAKANMRRRMMACTTSIGPGATNLVTAAALSFRAPPTRCCSSSRTSTTAGSRSTIVSSRSRATSTASCGPSNSLPRCRGRSPCSPIPRCAVRSRSRCRRTCRRWRQTSPRSSSRRRRCRDRVPCAAPRRHRARASSGRPARGQAPAPHRRRRGALRAGHRCATRIRRGASGSGRRDASRSDGASGGRTQRLRTAALEAR